MQNNVLKKKEFIYYQSIINDLYLPSFGFQPTSVGCTAERDCFGAFRKS
jgi:hypothetical protein